MNAVLDELIAGLDSLDGREPPPWFEPVVRAASAICFSVDDEPRLLLGEDDPIVSVFGTPVKYHHKIPAGWALIVMAPAEEVYEEEVEEG